MFKGKLCTGERMILGTVPFIIFMFIPGVAGIIMLSVMCTLEYH